MEAILMYAVVKNVFRNDGEQYNEDFTDNHMMLLVHMQRFRNIKGEINFNLDWTFTELKINYNLQQQLIQCIKDLQNFGLLTINTDIPNIDRYTWLQVWIGNYDDSFTQVSLNIFDKIFSLDVDIRRKKTMLFLYTTIKSYIDDKGFCYPSFSHLKKALNTKSDNRVSDALALLQRNKIIDYQNPGQVVMGNGKVTQGNNIYVLCEKENYQEILRSAVDSRKEQLEEQDAKIYKGKNSNKKRSIKQQINHLQKIDDKEKIEQLQAEYNKLNNDKPSATKKVKVKQPNDDKPIEVEVEEPSNVVGGYWLRKKKKVEDVEDTILTPELEEDVDTDSSNLKESDTLKYIKSMKPAENIIEIETDDLLPFEMEG